MSFTPAKAELFIDFLLGNKFAMPVTIDVLSGVATVTSAGHGLSPGDFVQIMFASPDGLRGDKVILTTPTADTFTYDATGVADGPATGTIAYRSGLVKVFQGKQDEASANKPAISYRIMSNRPMGMSAESFEDIDGILEETLESKRLIALEIQFYTKTEQQALDPDELARDPKLSAYISANALAVEIETKTMLTRSRRHQKLNGFSVLSVNTISDIDEYVGDRWERRALCEFNIHDTSSLTEETDFYDPDKLNIELNIEGL